MNKRQAKKRMNKAMEAMKTSRRSGMGVSITTQVFVDRTGKKCDAMQQDARFIILKRPKIQYFKSTNWNL